MKAQSTTLYDYTKTMPVPRGSLFGVPDENFPKSDNKKHIRWDDENLRRNEMTKTARDIIDEPDTPWASPPPELFDSDDEEKEENARKKTHEEEIKARLERMEMKGESGGVSAAAATTTTTTRRSTGVRFVAGGTTSSNNNSHVDDDFDDDAILKSRLFEAQRKSLQCTYDRKKGTTFNKMAHPYARDDNREKYDEDKDEEDDKDEEEIKRELEALLNMQKSSSSNS